VYHERHIETATKLQQDNDNHDTKRHCVLAYEMYGDSLMKKGDFPLAEKTFEAMLRNTGR